MTLLLDTNVLSELRRSRRDERVAAWAASITAHGHYISAITLFELEVGVLRLERRDPAQGAPLRSWLDDTVRPGYAGRILPVDAAVAMRAATFFVPDPRPDRDALIAATAAVHGLTIATRNVRDFEPMGVPTVNPWDG